jgi:hypothetical protein
MTDERVATGTTDSPYVTITPGDILDPMLAPTTSVRAEADAPRQYERGRSPGVDWDVESHASCATCTDPVEGEQLLDVSGDERLVPGGAAEQEWHAKAARHREGQWPPPDDIPVDRRAVREGLGRYQYQ